LRTKKKRKKNEHRKFSEILFREEQKTELIRNAQRTE